MKRKRLPKTFAKEGGNCSLPLSMAVPRVEKRTMEAGEKGRKGSGRKGEELHSAVSRQEMTVAPRNEMGIYH